MPVYNDTPQATQRISDTQSLIQTNFQSISTTCNINHIAITDGTNYGKHKFLQMPEQGASPTTLANEGAVFTRQGATSTVSELCYRRESNGSVIEMTARGGTTNGWSYLPSGLLMKWGSQGGTGDFTIINNTAPYFTSIYNVQITGDTNDITSNGKTMVLRTWSIVPGVRFTLNLTSVERLSNLTATGVCYWLAIGI